MPEDAARRELFTTAATQFYEEIVAHAGLSVDDRTIAEGGARKAAFDLLVELGLVVEDQSGERWLPVDPAAVQSRVVTPLGQEGARMIAESAAWAEAFSALSHSWRRSPESVRGPFTEIRGVPAIIAFITSQVSEVEQELLTAQPQAGRDSRQLAEAIERETEALRRGVRMRTLYQHSARRNAVTHKYVAAVTAEGAEVRTLDEFFNRMIVFDRRIAMIPGHDSLNMAVVIREPSIVAYLADIFERSWERARPFINRDTTLLEDIAAEQRAMTIRMLIEGYADPAGAKRVGVSTRTYAGYVADLKEEFEVETRFQLGYVLGQRGVSGQELPGEAD